MTLERSKPDPIPRLHPVWEYEAQGDLREVYAAYKTTLQVPWVGVVSLAYAHYRSFFDTWWSGLAPLLRSQLYADTCFALRREVEARVARLAPPQIGARLQAEGYSPRELAQIRDMIEVMSHGNFIQLAAVFAARMLLEGDGLHGGGAAGPDAAPHAPAVSTPFVLIEPHHALEDLGAVYEDVKTCLGLPFVNTDYRCFSRWPSYFRMAWQDLRPQVPTADYEALALETHEAIVAATRALPNPGGLTAAALQRAAASDASVAEVHEVTRLFTWLLPGLMINVAFFRAQLMES